MPVVVAPIGEEMTITKVIANEKTKRHLENLGILSGEKITLVNECNGDIIVKIKDGRIALNNMLAMKIFVA